MDNRRHDDERIDNISETMAGMKILLEQVHRSWFGANGNDGYKTKIDKMEGGMAVWKWVAGSGGLVGIIALMVTLYRLFTGG
jgi:hypothetical protein